MKASTFCFTTLLVAASLFTSKALAVEYSVRSDSGTQCYRLEAPAGYTPDVKHLQDPLGFAYNSQSNVPGEGARIPITAGAAEVAAVGWAGGLLDHDPGYSNSLTNLGAKTPGGFYNASWVHPTHVERVEGPTSYYRVEMSGVVAGEHQKLYAYVLDDGMLVRPESIPCYERHVVRHHRKWGGAETKKWGGKHH